MTIVHFAAGAGPMYCGACARDAALVRGLLDKGCDVTLIPLYTPLKLDSPEDLDFAPIFLGGINAYLQQLDPKLSRLPLPVKRFLDRPWLLAWASRFGVRTQPKDLGPMTVSVLQGPDGRQAAELEELMEFLAPRTLPDVFAITNSLLSGIAPELRRRFRRPIVCHLQGEESFVAGLPPKDRAEAVRLIEKNSDSIDLFLATSEANRDASVEDLGIPRDRVAILRPGVDCTEFVAVERRPPSTPTVGYLSSILPSKGLDLLVEAFIRLAQAHGREDVRLRVAGRCLDGRFLRAQKSRLKQAGLLGRVQFDGEIGLEAKKSFFREIDVLALPTRIPESRGIVALEALASGCPVLAPDSGIFPEVAADTHGARLYTAKDSTHLAVELNSLLIDRDHLTTLGADGARHVRDRYSADQMVESALLAYGSLVAV